MSLRIFEPHAHMISRVTDDYENMPDLALVSAAVAGDERAADELERRRAAAKP